MHALSVWVCASKKSERKLIVSWQYLLRLDMYPQYLPQSQRKYKSNTTVSTKWFVSAVHPMKLKNSIHTKFPTCHIVLSGNTLRAMNAGTKNCNTLLPIAPIKLIRSPKSGIAIAQADRGERSMESGSGSLGWATICQATHRKTQSLEGDETCSVSM